MIKLPPYLKKGDKIAVVCPAKKLPSAIDEAVKKLQEWGLEVVIGETVTASHHQFAGSDILRAKDLQKYMDDTSVKAIIAGRGGYGTIRIIDEIDYAAFNRSPKWFVGFSDITILLNHTLAVHDTASIHGQMPMTFEDASPASLESLHSALFGEIFHVPAAANALYRIGEASGILTGGNLT
ncbi:MAG: LD-carboxypeptidase, partial [Chitinophagaceae bacterium]